MTLGQKIKKLRTEKGLTQKDLADQVHVTFQTVSKWENDENEPDVSTLKALAKLFDCSMDFLLSEEDEQIKNEEEVVATSEPAEETKTIIIHQKELHVCERCNKDIPEDELVMEDIQTRPYHRGHAAEYRKACYHKGCLEELNKERAEKKAAQKAYHSSSSAKKCFGWGIAGGVIALGGTLAALLAVPELQAIFHPAIAVLIAIGAGYAIFADLYCIISGSYISDVFLWCAGLSIKFPGLIFSWDLGGLIWLIWMKFLFAVIGFLVGVFALILAIGLSAVLAIFSFPFVLIHNIHTDYEDAL